MPTVPASSLSFWHYNKTKFFRFTALALIAIPAIVFSIDFFTGGPPNVTNDLLFSMLLFATYILLSLLEAADFAIVKKLLMDTSEKSIVPLFDSDVVVDMRYEESKFSFAKPLIFGHISGLPVWLSYESRTRYSYASITFSFYPLSHWMKGEKLNRDLKIHLNAWEKLRADVKPEVLQFVEDLKTKGYTAANDE